MRAGVWAHERTHAGQSWTLFPNKALSLFLSQALSLWTLFLMKLSLSVSLSLSLRARENSHGI